MATKESGCFKAITKRSKLLQNKGLDKNIKFKKIEQVSKESNHAMESKVNKVEVGRQRRGKRKDIANTYSIKIQVDKRAKRKMGTKITTN